MKNTLGIALALGLASLLACVTINVYFPEAAVRDLAVQIEDAVQERAQEEAEATTEQSLVVPAPGVLPSRVKVFGLLAAILGGLPAEAQTSEVVDPAVSNPAIRKIIESRGKRARALRKAKDQGVLGEGKDAHVVIRSLEGLALKDRAALQKLVKAENVDRDTMFKEIAAATGVDHSQLAQIQATYAETLRAKAKVGDWIQTPAGAWKQKS